MLTIIFVHKHAQNYRTIFVDLLLTFSITLQPILFILLLYRLTRKNAIMINVLRLEFLRCC